MKIVEVLRSDLRWLAERLIECVFFVGGVQWILEYPKTALATLSALVLLVWIGSAWSRINDQA